MARLRCLGFYDNVVALSATERNELAKATPWIEREWHTVTEAPQYWGESEFSLHERTGARPTLEINGIASGYHEPGFKTVLPAKALAKISCRLVAHQEPMRIFQLFEGLYCGTHTAYGYERVAIRGLW